LPSAPLSRSAQRVQDALTALGFSMGQVVELPATTRTAAEAAAAIGCTVAQIAKSLVFRGAGSGAPVLVIASGANRVDTTLVARALGEPLVKADADFVRAETGFVIGGVPPVGHDRPLRTFIDQDLRQFEVIWAAAGTPNAVFRLTPADLERMTGGEVLRVT
jgi:prolyl-tRNA editing enzyme YbaK/EbsC (Cys-tRNA(Pro) deacylase)